MALISGIFKPRNVRLRCAHQFCQLLLGELRFGASLVDQLRDFGVNQGFVGLLAQLRVLTDHPVQDFNCIARFWRFWFSLRHKYGPPGRFRILSFASKLAQYQPVESCLLWSTRAPGSPHSGDGKNTVFDTARDLASPEVRKCHPAENLPLAAAVRGQSG